MKRFKRIISSVLAALLTLSALVTVTNAKQFTDVSSTAPLLDAINYAVDNNFIEGTSSTTFSPNSYMTRGNMVLMLYRHSGEPSTGTNTGFTDVPSSSPYARAVAWAKNNGITTGTTTTTFEPNTNIRRKHAALMMYRYADKMGHRTDMTTSLDGFTDVASVSNDDILIALKWAVAAGIMNGTSATTLEPHAYIKRGAAAAMLQRYGFTAEGLNYSRDVYNFGNNYRFFQTSYNLHKYYLNDNDYATLEYYADQNDVPNDIWENLLKFMSGHYYYYNENGSLCEGYKWGGSCYGMCVTTLLDKYGQINVNSRATNTSNLNDISVQQYSPAIESMINYYQLLYYPCGVSYATLDSIMWYLRVALRFNELCVINYHGSNPNDLQDDLYHAIIAYDIIEYGTNGQVFDIKVYDPISPSSNGYIRVVLEDPLLATVRSCVYYNSPLSTHPTQIIDSLGFCDYALLAEFFKPYDLDGPYNTGVSNILITNESEDLGANISSGLVSLNDLINDDKLTIYVSGGEDFSITNADGESIYYDSNTDSLSGSMNLYRVAKTQVGYANAPFTYVITTDCSDSFDLVTDSSDICDFYILTNDSFSGVTAKEFDAVTISNCNSVKVFGDNNIKPTISHGNVQMVFDTKNILDK